MIISKTPLRISFAGGGTDLQSYYQTGYGAVVSMTINRYIYVTVHKRFDRSIRVSYSETEIVDNVNQLKHTIVRECLKMVGIDTGIEITTIGEVPSGTGMGSSSTLTVGLLNALYTYKGIFLSSEELVKRACKIEIDILKNPIGKQDQSAAGFGGINYIRFNSDESITRDQLVISDLAARQLEHNLMLFYTGIRRSANVILQKQKAETASKLDILNAMRDQAEEVRVLLQHDDTGVELGHLMDRSWKLKRAVTDTISNSQIDVLYEKALSAGAVGGKLLGAGGGGFLLLYVEDKNQEQVRQALGLNQMYFHIEKYGSSIVYFNE